MNSKFCISKKLFFSLLLLVTIVGFLYLSNYATNSKKISNSQAAGECTRRYSYLGPDNKTYPKTASTIAPNSCEYRVRSYKVGSNTFYENAYTGYYCADDSQRLELIDTSIVNCKPQFYGQRDLHFHHDICNVAMRTVAGVTNEPSEYCKKNTDTLFGAVKIGSLFYGYDFQDANLPIYQQSLDGKNKQYINKHFDIIKPPVVLEGLPAYVATSLTYVAPTSTPPAAVVATPVVVPTAGSFNHSEVKGCTYAGNKVYFLKTNNSLSNNWAVAGLPLYIDVDSNTTTLQFVPGTTHYKPYQIYQVIPGNSPKVIEDSYCITVPKGNSIEWKPLFTIKGCFSPSQVWNVTNNDPELLNINLSVQVTTVDNGEFFYIKKGSQSLNSTSSKLDDPACVAQVPTTAPYTSQRPDVAIWKQSYPITTTPSPAAAAPTGVPALVKVSGCTYAGNSIYFSTVNKVNVSSSIPNDSYYIFADSNISTTQIDSTYKSYKPFQVVYRLNFKDTNVVGSHCITIPSGNSIQWKSFFEIRGCKYNGSTVYNIDNKHPGLFYIDIDNINKQEKYDISVPIYGYYLKSNNTFVGWTATHGPACKLLKEGYPDVEQNNWEYFLQKRLIIQ